MTCLYTWLVSLARVGTCLYNWLVEDWQRVLRSEEAPYELYHPAARQKDRVWVTGSSDVPTVTTVRHPAKVHVWGMTSTVRSPSWRWCPTSGRQYRLLPGEHPRQECPDAANRSAETGSVLQCSLMTDISRAVFMQDGSPTHTAMKTRQHLSALGAWRMVRQ